MRNPFRTAFAAYLGWITGKAFTFILIIALMLILGALNQ